MPTRFVILTIILFVFSCSNSKKSRKADSNFFAYYNSFFIAEKSFNEAIEDIESMEEVDGNISSKAKNLFEEAIKNALIIEKDFYQTKYLDDAYFILGKSSYFINRLTSSKYYFNRLKNEFPNSEFLEEVLIWLSYVDLEIGYIDQVKEDLLLYKANYNQMNNSKKYLTDLLFAKVANYEDEINDEKVHYISAITHSINKYQKLFLYRKLLLIAEYEKNYAEAILYINYIEKNSDNNLSENLLEKWFLYNRLLANHDDVLNKINKKIDGELSPIDYIYYKIEKSKTFLDKNEIDKSINVLNEIIDKYKEDNTYKNKLGEAYLLLGEIYLKYFNDINIAKEKFELCKEVSSSSTTYNKKSKKYIESILNFESLVHEIEYLSQTDNEESIISDKSDDENIADEHQDFNTFMLPMPADSTNNIEIDSDLTRSTGNDLWSFDNHRFEFNGSVTATISKETGCTENATPETSDCTIAWITTPTAISSILTL